MKGGKSLEKNRIIDAHCHIYPDKIADKAAAATSTFYDGLGATLDGRVATLIAESDKAGIDHSIVQSVATTPKQVSSINRFISETVSSSGGRLTGLGTLHPDSEDIAADVDELISLGLHGVKLHPDIQKFKIDDYRCLKIYELCEKKGLPILMHTGDYRYDYSNPNRLVPVLEIYDKLTVVGAHFGGWSVWREAARKLRGFRNLYVDTSSSLYDLRISEARELIYMYSADRILFGTDFPMWAPDEEIERYKALKLSPEQNEKILFQNACRVFDMKI